MIKSITKASWDGVTPTTISLKRNSFVSILFVMVIMIMINNDNEYDNYNDDNDPPSHLADCAIGRSRESHSLLTPFWNYARLALHCKHGFVGFDDNRMIMMNMFEDLKVTTACREVLLPSNQPLGRIPGEPQLISDFDKIVILIKI